MDIFNVSLPEEATTGNIDVYTEDGRYLGYVVPPTNGSAHYTAIAHFKASDRKKSCGAFPTADHAARVLRAKFAEDPGYCQRIYVKRGPRIGPRQALVTALREFHTKEVQPRIVKPDQSTAGFLACWILLGKYLPKRFRAAMEREPENGNGA